MAAMINILTVDDQVFLLLVTEMAVFMLLVIPLPFSLRRRIFTYVNGWRGPVLGIHTKNTGRGNEYQLTWVVMLASSRRIQSWQNYNTVSRSPSYSY